MSCVAGHQPNAYPYGGFFAKMAAVEEFVIVDNTQYVKKQYHNRNRVLLASGEVFWLGVPVLNAGKFHQAINEAIIDNRHNWRGKHLKTLSWNYRGTPFFDAYYPEFAALLERGWERLVDFNLAVIKLCAALLEISTPLRLGSELGIAGKATELIGDICAKTGADTYLHGMHSRDYVDFTLLAGMGVRSRIQDFTAIPYPQRAPGFVHNLSALDTIFNLGGSGAREQIVKSSSITRYAP